MMSKNFIFVRHAKSEGNLLNERSRENMQREQPVHVFPDGAKKRHASLWRLTDQGKAQVRITKEWIRNNLDFTFDRFLVSTDLRARETAALLDLPDARWAVRSNLRERDRGALARIPEERKNYPEEVLWQEIDEFHSRPSRGESMTDVLVRLDIILNELGRKCSMGNAIIVCHRGIMWAFRYRLEQMLPAQYLKLYNSNNSFDRINNCQIIHYTRINPETGEETETLGWMRSICPWDTSLSSNEWQPVVHKKFSNEELLAQVEEVERLIHD